MRSDSCCHSPRSRCGLLWRDSKIPPKPLYYFILLYTLDRFKNTGGIACGCVLERVVFRVRFARVSCPWLRFEGSRDTARDRLHTDHTEMTSYKPTEQRARTSRPRHDPSANPAADLG